MLLNLRNKSKTVKHKNILLKRVVLLSLVALLFINIAQPADILPLISKDQKVALTNPSALNAYTVDTTDVQSIADPSIGTLDPAPQITQQPHEIVSERTATTNTYVNSDGSKTMTYSPVAKNYESDGEWKELNPTTRAIDYKSGSKVEYNVKPPINNLSNDLNLTDFLFKSPTLTPQPQAYELSTGDLQATLKPFSDGISVNYKDKTISLKPISSRNVVPVIETTDQSEVTIYKNAWQNVNVEYELRGASLKETLILNNQSAATDFTYKVEGGAKIIPHPTIAGALAVEGINPDEFYISQLSVNVNNRGIISDQTANWTIDGDILHLSIDKTWFSSLTSADFPVGD
jgi:hypothetical protein